MRNKHFLLYGLIAVLVVSGGWAYQKITDDTYEGMSIIPEEHKDIPVFEGLEPKRSRYVIQGNRWREIYTFYSNALPDYGWDVEYEDSALADSNEENDWSGFQSYWRKEGFDGELGISASYNRIEDETKVIFDKTPIYQSTAWFGKVPESICVDGKQNSENCEAIEEEADREKIVNFINDAIDWESKGAPGVEMSVMTLGDIEVKVLYGKDKEIFFQSEKGMKMMKPDPDFFEAANLSP
ncbi:hypothetical protein SAMN05421743_103227 [Thalassobacillus cyri]|uniref:Uncharacterized protein n=1 Tax=Thalassobacillus cyri TaxID=571932 RepID=A0A1H3ZFF0_9BACI|nr:hypothetical protein [Thalassobacillus cyri]SEA22410.1 hypothetical protein SAMN05421743_103227 [Thalassobacillus cyri]